MKVALLGLLALFVLMLWAACGDGPEPTPAVKATEESIAPDPTSVPPTATVTPTATAVSTPTPTPTATPVPPPTATPTATPLPAAVQRVVPSMVRMQVDGIGVGSGFLAEGNYIVTAAHVAWPYAAVEVVFEDGTEYTSVPVVSYDHLTDLAFLGPIDTAAPYVKLANIETVREGETVFVLGYPELTLGISFTNGEFEFSWQWDDADIMQFSSTSAAKFGMSGGPIVNADGEVIGVLTRGDESGSTGTSSNTVQNQLLRALMGEEVSPAGPRPLITDKGRYEHEFVLHGRLDSETFIFRDHDDTPISIEFEAPKDVEFGLFDGYGDADFRPAFRSTRRGLHDSCCFTGTWYVVVRQRFDLEREVMMRSSVPLAPYRDPDDDRKLQVGDTVGGVFDTAGDIDSYFFVPAAGQHIGIRFETNDGMQVTIDYPDAPPYETVSAEGNYEEVTFQASVNVVHTIALQPNWGTDGYTLSVFETESSARGKPDNVISSPVGDMLRHSFEHSEPTIHIDYPLNITGGNHAEVLGAVMFEEGRRGQTIALEEREMTFLRQSPQEELSLDKYVRRSPLVHGLPVFSERVTASREIVTPSGAPILIEYFEADEGETEGVRLAYIHEGETGFMAIFYAPADVFDEWRQVVDYCIGSFSIGDFSVADGM